MAKLSEYVKVAEAAEILGVSQGTLRTWAENGKIPFSAQSRERLPIVQAGGSNLLSAEHPRTNI